VEPLLHIDALLDGGSYFFTKLDLASNYYHQLRVRASDQ
jgi:hypothetical protein